MSSSEHLAIRRSILLTIAMTITVSLTACDHGTPRAAIQNTSQPSETITGDVGVDSSMAETQNEVEEVDCLNKFVEEYNAASPTPLTIVEEFNPHDESTEHYRTEFRLGAFDGSKGLYCTDGDLKVWIVNYGSHGGFYPNNCLRIYAEGPIDQVAECYRTAAKILDPDISIDDIDKAINSELEEGYSMGRISGTDLDGMYFNQTSISDAELMLDSSHYAS